MWKRSRYPATWESFRTTLLARANGRCEGTPLTPECQAYNYEAHPDTGSLVILTIAHLCRCDPLCDEPSHCRALCQKCHCTLDSDLHALHTAETRRLQKEALGQLSFLE